MADAQDFVNNALNGDDDPSSYVDWLGKKEDVGPLARIRFGVRIHTTDEEVIAQNAKEDGTVTDEAFWKQIVEDAHWLEENMAILLREMGLYVQGEGHGDSGEYVGSAWILATLPQEQQVYVAKKILDLADGDMPSTTNGTLWKCFYDSTTKLYRNVNQEIGAKYLDVTVEFTGTDALTEWLKLNLVESEAVDADDPAMVVQSYREKYYQLLYGAGFNCGAYAGTFSSVDQALSAAKERKLLRKAKHVWIIEEHVPDAPTGVFVGSEPTGAVWDVVKGYQAVRRVTEAQDADDPAMFVQHFLPRMTGRLMIEFNAIRPHFPDAPKNFFRENADGLILFQHNRASEMREIMRQMHVYNREREDRNEIPMVTYRYMVPNPHGDVLAREFLEKAGTNVETIAWAEKTNAPIWFYMSVDEFNNYLRYVYPQIKLKEDIDDPDAPEGYLDRVTGWIDTFIHAGLVPDPSPAHSNQFWKRYECDGTNFTIFVHVRPPLWILVVRTHPTTGTGQFTLPFTFNEKDTAGMVTQFRALDRLLTKCRTRARGDWPTVDAEIIDMEKQNERDRKLKLSGRRKLGEAVEDEPEVDPQTYADQIHNLAQITHDIQEYGLFVNRIHVWGRWVVLGGGAYWATETAASEKRLKADYFNRQIDSFMAKLGITRYHIKSGETTIGDNVWFQLALPKDQLEQESWQPFIRNTAWPEPDHETWLPEAQEAAPDEADDPELNVERHTADLDLPAIMNRLGFKAVHFKHTGTTYWEKVVGPRCFTVSRDKGQNALLKVHASFGTPQSWVDASVASVPINELETTLNETPYFFLLPDPDDPVVESVDPDDPSVNVDRHVAAMEPGPVLAELGFNERWPSWNCADPTYMWWERFDSTTGVKWTVIRKSDDEPHIMDVSISRMNPVTKDWQQVGGFNVHVGSLRKKLERAFGVNWKTYEAVDDPDAPEPNIEAYKQHVEKTEADALESAIANALLMFGHRVSNVDNAQRADELAVEIATYWAEAAGYQNGSDEYDHIVSALSNRAGELFPGDWEDYPNTLRPPLAESLVSAQMDWSEFFAPLIAANLLSQAAADKYARSQNLESNEQLYYLFLEADEASQYANDDDYNACIDKILRIIRVTNMRYGSAIKNIATNPALDTSLEENVDDVDDPSPALLSDAFDVPTILKRRGYERHGDDYAWTKVFRNLGGIDYHIEVRQRGYGGGADGSSLYDTTLYHFLPGTKEGAPIAERFARNNKNLEPMLKALEARVAARGNQLRGIAADPDEVVESVDPDDPENVIGKGGKWIIVAAKPHPHKPGRTFKIFVTLWNSTYLDNPKDTTTEFGYPGAENHWQSWEPRPQGWRDAQIIKARFDRQVGQPGGWTTELVPYNPDKSIVWHQRYLKENIDDPDDAAMAVNTYTQDLVADPDEVKINKHPHGEAEAELEVLGFKPSWIAGKNTIFGEPEIPNFWSKSYRSAVGGSSKLLYVKIIPEGKDAAISVRTRSMSIPVALKPRSMAHIVTIIKDVDAAVQRAADNGLTKEQEIDAIVGVLDHHRQWCRPS